MLDKILAFVVAAVMSIAAAETPATPTDMYAAYNDGVVVCIEMDTPISEIRYGDTITLRCAVQGVHEPYTIQWQHSTDKKTWEDLPCNDNVYEFVLTKETAGTYYRAAVYTESQ